MSFYSTTATARVATESPRQIEGLTVRRFGSPEEVLILESRPRPELAKGEVLVQILASPVHPVDRLMIHGLYPLVPDPPFVPGAEGMGQVVDRESDTDLEIGMRVVLPMREGAWRTHLAIRADRLSPVSPTCSLEQAATVRVNGLTAWLLLKEISRLEPGEWFIHSPATGNLGQYLVQLARLRGVRSVSVVRDANRIDRLEQLGGDAVLTESELSRERVSEATSGADIGWAFDGVGGDLTTHLAKALAPGGTVVCYGAMSREASHLRVDQTIFRGIKMQGFWLSHHIRDWPQSVLDEHIMELSELDLDIEVSARLSLSDWRRALLGDSRAGFGKILLCPDIDSKQ